MRCPYCGCTESRVVDSRPTDEGERIRRRRECLNCTKRFTTYEIVETTPLMIVKRDNSREPFNREKLTNGLLRACEKRPISLDDIDAVLLGHDVVVLFLGAGQQHDGGKGSAKHSDLLHLCSVLI